MQLEKAILAIVTLLIASQVVAQKQTNHWYFGYQAGLDFSSGIPVAVTDGKLVSIEGSSVMSDADGKLLFYSNGEALWNRKHELMSNGQNLKGDNSSVQSALIIPMPDSPERYYLFTTSFNDGFQYSVVDMSLDGGLGDVVPGKKNVLLSSTGSESQAATRHCNSQDYWILTLVPGNTLVINAYLLCSSGLSGPMTTDFGIPLKDPQQVAHLRFSADGQRLVVSLLFEDSFILDFNKSTGKLALSYRIPGMSQNSEGVYASAFSPDNTKLYQSAWEFQKLPAFCKLVQYDLTAADIFASRVVLDKLDYSYGSPIGYGFRGNLQTGPDGRIYVNRWKQTLPVVTPESPYTLDSLDVINDPNQKGYACHFMRNQVWLNGRPAEIGLPNFLDSFFDKTVRTPFFINADFVADTVCSREPKSFQDLSTSSCQISSWEWTFGDAASGNLNYSTQANPTHRFNDPGIYTVTLKVFSGCAYAEVSKSILVSATPHITLNAGRDTILCKNDVLLLTAQADGGTYRWNDGSGGNTFTVTKPGVYWIEVTDGTCAYRDSVAIQYVAPPSFTLGDDAILCEGQTLKLDVSGEGLTYAWQDGSNAGVYTVVGAGTFWIDVANQACHVRDTIVVSYVTVPDVALPSDTIVCWGKSVLFDIGNPDFQYTWSDNSTLSQFVIVAPGDYWVDYGLKGTSCIRRKDIHVSYEECLDDLFIPNIITPDGDGRNDSFRIEGAEATRWRLRIYNRWGQIITEFADYDQSWAGDGRNSGIYFYTLTSKLSGREFKGILQVNQR